MNAGYFNKTARQRLLYRLYQRRVDTIIDGLRVDTPNTYPNVLPHFAIQLDGGPNEDEPILRYSVDSGRGTAEWGTLL